MKTLKEVIEWVNFNKINWSYFISEDDVAYAIENSELDNDDELFKVTDTHGVFSNEYIIALVDNGYFTEDEIVEMATEYEEEYSEELKNELMLKNIRSFSSLTKERKRLERDLQLLKSIPNRVNRLFCTGDAIRKIETALKNSKNTYYTLLQQLSNSVCETHSYFNIKCLEHAIDKFADIIRKRHPFPNVIQSDNFKFKVVEKIDNQFNVREIDNYLFRISSDDTLKSFVGFYDLKYVTNNGKISFYEKTKFHSCLNYMKRKNV